MSKDRDRCAPLGAHGGGGPTGAAMHLKAEDSCKANGHYDRGDTCGMRHSSSLLEITKAKLNTAVVALMVLLLAAVLIIPAVAMAEDSDEQSVDAIDVGNSDDDGDTGDFSDLEDGGFVDLPALDDDLIDVEAGSLSTLDGIEGIMGASGAGIVTTEGELSLLSGTGSISGFLWLDGNGMAATDWNGLYDAGEQPLGGLWVYLYDVAELDAPLSSKSLPIASALTGPNGIFSFDNLAPGSYALGLFNGYIGTTEYLLPFDRTTDCIFGIDWDAIDWGTWDDDVDRLIATTEVIELLDGQVAGGFNAGMRLPMGIQATALLDDIKSAPLYSVVNIDGWNWYVARKYPSASDVQYVMLMRTVHAGGPQVFSNTSNNYSGSQLQSRMQDYYTSFNLPTIKALAVVPDLGNHTSTTAVSTPTPVSAGSRTMDIFFAPSYYEIFVMNGNSINVGGVIGNYPARFYTRTAHSSPNYVYEVFPAGGAIPPGGTYIGSTYVYDVPCVWIGVAGKRTVTVNYVDSNGVAIGSPSSRTYEVDFRENFSLSASDIPDIANYAYSGWKKNLPDALLTTPVLVENVMYDTTIYLVYDEAPRERYLVSKDDNPDVILSTWHWLASAVDACGTDGPYTITATENDYDMSDSLGAYPREPIQGAYKNQAVVIPANKSITLTSEAGELYTITQLSANRHLEVLGVFTITNIKLHGNNTGGGVVVGTLTPSPTTSFTMQSGSTIQNCLSSGRGGGVLVNGAVFSMESGNIINNMASLAGGGVYLEPGSVFNMSGNSLITSNRAPFAGGVGIDAAIFDMASGTISSNTANALSGGGIWVSKGSTCTIHNGEISSNHAPSGNGGGIFTTDYANLYIDPRVSFSGNTASMGYDTGHTQDEYIAAFQTALNPMGIYSPYNGTYSTHPTLSFKQPVNNYDINVVIYFITEKYRDVSGAAIADPLNPGSTIPDTTTIAFYGKPYSKVLPSISGYQARGYFVGTSFNPPSDVYTPGTSVTNYPVSGDMIIFFVYDRLNTLTISKKVTGFYALKGQLWEFTLYLRDSADRPLSGSFLYAVYDMGGNELRVGTLVFDNINGSDSFELKHNERIVIDDVPGSASLRIIETPDDNYDTSFIDSDYPTIKIESNDTADSDQGSSPFLIMTPNRQFDFTNAWIDVPDEGIGGTGLPTFTLLALILAAAAGGLLFVVRRHQARC